MRCICLGKPLSTAIGPDKVDDSGYIAECKNQHANQKSRYVVGRSNKVMILMSGEKRANQQKPEARNRAVPNTNRVDRDQDKGTAHGCD
jgi:pyruvoyl-dependent arginine decarboxylase (PvlArgDC)